MTVLCVFTLYRVCQLQIAGTLLTRKWNNLQKLVFKHTKYVPKSHNQSYLEVHIIIIPRLAAEKPLTTHSASHFPKAYANKIHMQRLPSNFRRSLNALSALFRKARQHNDIISAFHSLLVILSSLYS